MQRDRAALWFYRGAALVLTAILACAAWVFDRAHRADSKAIDDLKARLDASHGEGPVRSPEPGEITIEDVSDLARSLAAKHPTYPDVVQKFFESPRLTIHLHMMAPGQLCPLHLHRATDEAVVIVDGTATVRHVHGKDGSLVSTTHDFPPGSVIETPAHCGHEWTNRSKDAGLANLVITLPEFEGNRYVAADDPELLRGPAPATYDPTADLARSEPYLARDLPEMKGALWVLVTKGEAKLDAGAGKVVAAYALRGAGTLAARPFHEHDLAIVRGPTTVAIQAEAGKPLAALVIREP